MTRTTLFTTLIAVGLLAAPPTFAGQWEGNVDLQGSILNDLDKLAFVGTGFSVASPRIDAYSGLTAGNVDIDHSGFAIGYAGPERSYGPWGHGNVDAYGTVLPQ